MSYIVRGQFWSDDTFQQKSKALKIMVKTVKNLVNLAPLGTWGKKYDLFALVAFETPGK